MQFPPDDEPPFEGPPGPRTFWRAIGCRAAGVAIVTTAHSGEPAGFLALSATHLCADPPILTVAVGRTTSATETLLRSGVFAVNFLRADAAEIYERFTARDGPKGAARFAGLAIRVFATGAPVFEPVVGALDCRLEEAIERHETLICLGRIVAFRVDPDGVPMIHHRGALTT